jgi:hypothetical protein
MYTHQGTPTDFHGNAHSQGTQKQWAPQADGGTFMSMGSVMEHWIGHGAWGRSWHMGSVMEPPQNVWKLQIGSFGIQIGSSTTRAAAKRSLSGASAKKTYLEHP